MLYRHLRKAIEGEAVQFKEDGSNDALIASWFNLHPQRVKETDALSAHTLNGVSRRLERGKALKKFDGDWLIRTKTGGLYVTTAYDFATHWAKKDTFPPDRKIQCVESEPPKAVAPPPRIAPKKPEISRPADPLPNWKKEEKGTFRERLLGKKK